MPKRNFIPVQLAPEQYDKCVDCPLIGLIPENERKEGNPQLVIHMLAD